MINILDNLVVNRLLANKYGVLPAVLFAEITSWIPKDEPEKPVLLRKVKKNSIMTDRQFEEAVRCLNDSDIIKINDNDGERLVSVIWV